MDDLVSPASNSITRASVLFRRVRMLLLFFVVALVLSGVTAFPLETELHWITGLAGVGLEARAQDHTGLLAWLLTVREGLTQTNRAYPFLAYGTDWLAFAHLAIAALFWGPYRDPVRNVWVLDWGVLACLAVIPLALIAGEVRGIPFWWRLVDCSFALGAVPLFLCRQYTHELEQLRPGLLHARQADSSGDPAPIGKRVATFPSAQEVAAVDAGRT